MTREEEIKHASKDYVNYLLDKQEYHNEKYTEYDIKQAFEKGAEWADKNHNSKTITEYLYKEKGYPISLNGDIPTYEEVVKHVQAYNNYKMRQKACDDIESTDAEPNLESLWHDASGEPQGEYKIICQDEFEHVWLTDWKEVVKQHASGWEEYASCECIVHWAYVSDITPKGGEK